MCLSTQEMCHYSTYCPESQENSLAVCQALLLKVCGVSVHYALCRRAFMLVVTTPTEGVHYVSLAVSQQCSTECSTGVPLVGRYNYRLWHCKPLITLRYSRLNALV